MKAVGQHAIRRSHLIAIYPPVPPINCNLIRVHGQVHCCIVVVSSISLTTVRCVIAAQMCKVQFSGKRCYQISVFAIKLDRLPT